MLDINLHTRKQVNIVSIEGYRCRVESSKYSVIEAFIGFAELRWVRVLLDESTIAIHIQGDSHNL